MKNSIIIYFSVCLILFGLSSFVPDAYGECPPPEIKEFFLTDEDWGEVSLLSVGEASPAQLEHFKYMYNRLLVRDDKAEGKIRAAISKKKPVILIFEDEEDEEDFFKTYEDLKSLRKCNLQEILLEETHPLGTVASDLNLRDATLEEVLNLIYHYGIQQAYPSWKSRLKKAMSRAISAGTFNPYVCDNELEKEYWPHEYIGTGLEIYYGIWAKHEGGKKGCSVFNTREALLQGDPALVELIEEIFPKNLYQ